LGCTVAHDFGLLSQPCQGSGPWHNDKVHTPARSRRGHHAQFERLIASWHAHRWHCGGWPVSTSGAPGWHQAMWWSAGLTRKVSRRRGGCGARLRWCSRAWGSGAATCGGRRTREKVRCEEGGRRRARSGTCQRRRHRRHALTGYRRSKVLRSTEVDSGRV
jgi:hypothetical protein